MIPYGPSNKLIVYLYIVSDGLFLLGVAWCANLALRHLLFLDPHVKHLAKLGANVLRPGVRLNISKKAWCYDSWII